MDFYDLAMNTESYPFALVDAIVCNMEQAPVCKYNNYQVISKKEK